METYKIQLPTPSRHCANAESLENDLFKSLRRKSIKSGKLFWVAESIVLRICDQGKLIKKSRKIVRCRKKTLTKIFRISGDMGRFWPIFRLGKCTEESFSPVSGPRSSNASSDFGKSSILAITRIDILRSRSTSRSGWGKHKWMGQAIS